MWHKVVYIWPGEFMFNKAMMRCDSCSLGFLNSKEVSGKAGRN
jgi:hypothetical protein